MRYLPCIDKITGRFLKGKVAPFNCKCLVCGKQFRTKPSRIAIGKGKFCSKVCKGISQKGWWEKGKNPRWNNGIQIHELGYILLSQPKHPYSTKQGYVREHRLVMEQKLKRYLKPKEIVHHINGIKTDNRIDNLELVASQSEHIKNYHQYGGHFYGYSS